MKQSGARDCEHPGKPHAHGTVNAYDRDRCRCLRCGVAKSQAREAYARGESWREHTVDPVGVERRLQALNAMGWGWQELGDRLGMPKQAVFKLATGLRRQPRLVTAEKVQALYDELWNIEPTGTAAKRARLSAKRKGYLPPMAWDDDTIDDPTAEPNVEAEVGIDWQIVERAIAGKPRGRRLTKLERIAAAQAMAAKGATATQISKRLGMSGADVNRYTREEAA